MQRSEGCFEKNGCPTLERCRIWSRDHCLSTLELWQWATTSPQSFAKSESVDCSYYHRCGSGSGSVRNWFNNSDPGSTIDLYRWTNYPQIVMLKGQSSEIFDLQFFSSFEPALATDQWVKIFSTLVKLSPSYSNFYETPRAMILRRVNLPGESNDFSRSYLKGQSNKIFDLFFS